MDHYEYTFIDQLYNFVQSPINSYPKFKQILYEEFSKTTIFKNRLDYTLGIEIFTPSSTNEHHIIPPRQLPDLLQQWFYLLDYRVSGDLDEWEIPDFYEKWAQLYSRFSKRYGFKTI